MSKQQKKVVFEASSLDDLRDWPDEAKSQAGYQIHRLQDGLQPDSWKPLGTAGKGVREIRITAMNGWWRVVYVHVIEDTVHVLHCFKKKTNRISKEDLAIANTRYKDLINKK